MSQHVPPSGLSTDPVSLQTGLEAFHTSPDFHGPVESLDGHTCNDHFAHIYESDEDKFGTAVPFVRHGLERGERVMYIVDESTEAEVTNVLRDRNVDVDAALESGALSFHTIQETYLRNGTFDPDEMIDFYGQTVDAVSDDYTALRIIAETTWLQEESTTVEQFMDYESKINDLFEGEDCLALCQYDRQGFPPEVVRQIVQTHPHLIYDGAACHNFYYTPPEEFFGADEPAHEVDRMLGTLRERTEAKSELQQRQRFLEDLYETIADTQTTFVEKIADLLELGSEQFDLDIGYFTCTDADDTFEIVEAVGDHDVIECGVTDTLCDTYCEKLLASPGTITVTDAADAGWTDDAAYDRFGLDTYFATTVHVSGEEYGTLCFASESPREHEFTDAEKTFLELMGQWVEYELERQQREQFLRESYEITSNPTLDFDAKLERLLELGRKRMDLDAAGLTHLPEWDGKFLSEYTIGYGDDADGEVWTDPGEGYYCRQAITADEPVGKADVRGTDWEDDTIYREQGLSCYLGMKVTSRSTPYGTLWVGSSEPREREFTDAEKTFLELMGQWVSYELDRREREQELRESKNQLRALIDVLPVAVFVAEDDGEIVEWNDAAEEIWGGEVAESESVAEYDEYDGWWADTGEMVEPDEWALARALDGEEVTDPDEIEIEGFDGERRTVLNQGMPVRDADGEVSRAVVTLIDITERKEREAELRQTKNRFETVFEDSDDSIFIIDPEADEFVDVNPATYEMTGYDREELLSAAPSTLHADEMEQFRSFLDEVQENGSAWTEDLHCRAKDGRKIPAEISASTITLDGRSLVLALVRDITERKKHERYQRDLYEITADPDLEFEEKLGQLLELGRDRFGLEMAGLNELPTWDGKFRLEKGIGLGVDPNEELWTDPGDDCYCRRVVTEPDPVAVTDVRETDWTEDAIYQRFGMTSYLGTKVTSGSTQYGTLWFGSTEPRHQPFSSAERSFIELMGQWVSYELERREHNTSQQDLYEITADTDLATDEKVDRLLEAGCDRLNLPVGMVTRARGEAFEIEHMSGAHPELDEGTLTPPLTDNYCRTVVETGETIAVGDAGAAGWDGDALYDEFDLQCYTGTELTVGGATYGTVCFADTTPREEFTDTEEAFLDLLGQCVSYELDRHHRETHLQGLNALGRELLDTESRVEVADRVTETVDDVFEDPVATVALYDEEIGTLQPTAHTDAGEDLVTRTNLLARADSAGWNAFVDGEPKHIVDPFDGESTTSSDQPSVEEVLIQPLGTHGVYVVGSQAPTGFRRDEADFIEAAAANIRAALDRTDREEKLQEREEVLEEQNETLTRLNRINDTIRSIDQALVEASTRSEIQDVVCEELATSGPYELAWIGKHDGVTDEIRPVQWAGSEDGYLQGITVTADDNPEGRGPAGRAVKTGEPQVVNNVLTDKSFEPWRQEALNRGFQATASLPLQYDGTQYGVLNLYAGQPGVFDDLEREVLTELANTVAHAINAIESKKALISDEIIELEFDVTDTALEIVQLVEDLDCTFSLNRVVPQDDGGVRSFFTVDGASCTDVLDFESQLAVSELNVVSEMDDNSSCVFEALLTDDSLTKTVLDHGGQLRHLEADDGAAEVTIHLATDAEVREFVEMFTSKYPNSQLTAQRTRELSQQTALEFASTHIDELTERQQEALQTAYYNGYFEEPRARTGSEIADSMDIAQPTFNSHVRAAMRKLCRNVFEDEMAVE